MVRAGYLIAYFLLWSLLLFSNSNFLYGTADSNFMLASTESQVNACFLVHSIEAHVFNHSTRMLSLYLMFMGLLACAWALTRVAYIANTLQVLIAHYMFTNVCRVHYSSSSNSPVSVRIGNHTSKGRTLVLLVMTTFYYLYPNSIY